MDRESNLIAMRLGPGKYLKGRTLLGGVVKPEEFDYFHEVRALKTKLIIPSNLNDLSLQLIITQEFTRCGARGYGDGEYSVPAIALICLTSSKRSTGWEGHRSSTSTELRK